jgi:D-alanyl-D-alanine carboxypeptidase
MRLAVPLALAALACRTSTGVNKPAPQGPPPPTTLDPAGIDAWLASELARRGVVGASVVIVHEGATVFAKGYGTRTLGKQEAIDADTPFHIGSVGKQLACGAVMLLAEDGKLKLSDPVAKYYPNLVKAADITLEDLGAHMSGYRDFYPLDYKDRRFDKAIAPDELIAKYAGLPLDFEPRTRVSYSNTGYAILGRVAERVSGLTFGQLLEQRIFKPLEMTHSSYGVIPPGAATGHDNYLLGPVETTTPEAAGWLIGTAGVWASASDLAKWDLAFASGKLLDERSRRAMSSPHRTTDGREVLYGCGLGIRVRDGELVLSHTGAVEGFSSFNTFVPRIRAAVIVLANDFHADVGDLHDKLVSLLLYRPGDIPVIPGPTAEATAKSLVRQLQTGTLDRSKLGDDLNGFWDDKRIAEASGRLRALGEPRVTLQRRRERGNQEVTELELAFPTRTLHATMFRAPTGKIHQFMIRD